MSTQITVRTKMQETLEVLNIKLAKVKNITESPYKTNGEFRFNPAYTGNAAINIHKLTDLSLLIGILAAIQNHWKNYNNAAETLELATYPAFEWCGFSYEAWKHDIEIRKEIITQHETIKKLKTAKEKLQQFLTEEDRLAITLKEIEELI
jgi:hypothetical protein